MANTFSIKVALKLLTDNFEQGVNKASRATYALNKNISGIGNTLKNFAMAGVAAFGGVQLATTVFNGVIKASQTAGDAWALSMASVTGALDGLYRTIGTGDWSNLITNMLDSSVAARELTSALDELFEKGLGADLNNTSIDLEIAAAEQLRNIAKANKDYAEVIKQADIINTSVNSDINI